MSNLPFSNSCECCSSITRRTFIKSTVTGVAAATVSVLPFGAVTEAADRTKLSKGKKTTSETLVATLYQSLTEEQRKAVCYPFDHPLRSKVDNNWHITDKKTGTFFTRDQQAMIHEIFMKLLKTSVISIWEFFQRLILRSGN